MNPSPMFSIAPPSRLIFAPSASLYFLFIVLNVMWSCSDKPSSDNPSTTKNVASKIQLDEKLMKISSDAGVMQVALSTETMLQCMLADSLEHVHAQGTKNDIGGSLLQDMTSEATTLCGILSRAERETQATYDRITKEGRLLDEQYFFSIYTPGDSDDGFHKHDIGLFGALEMCRQIEQEAFRQGIPVKQCRKFEP